MHLKSDARAAAGHFAIPGRFLMAEPYGSGHINDTYRAVFEQNGAPVSYILQRINHRIFKNPPALMDNVRRVTAHLGQRCAPGQRVLELIPTTGGQAWYRDEAGNHWRAYVFITKARTFDVVESPAQAFQAGRGFGHFQKMLADLPAPRLHDTVPDFHHTPRRFAALERAIAADAAHRAQAARAEIEFALRRREICGVLLDAGLPERVTHNDCKLNNVMLDDATGAAVCVIDLDTVMSGLALYDFGDMVRTATNSGAEDERDLSKIRMDFPLFESLARGYLSAAAEFLTPAEVRLLAFSGRLITFEIGLRFLADFLAGDVYFKVHRPGQNLDRCRTQFKLVTSIEQQEEQMNQLVASIWRTAKP